MLLVPSFCRLQMEGTSTSFDSTSSLSSFDNDEEHAVLAIQIATQSILDLFHINEWKHGGQDSVNPHEGIRDVLESMRSTPGLFKVLTNFSIQEFHILC